MNFQQKKVASPFFPMCTLSLSGIRQLALSRILSPLKSNSDPFGLKLYITWDLNFFWMRFLEPSSGTFWILKPLCIVRGWVPQITPNPWPQVFNCWGKISSEQRIDGFHLTTKHIDVLLGHEGEQYQSSMPNRRIDLTTTELSNLIRHLPWHKPTSLIRSSLHTTETPRGHTVIHTIESNRDARRA